MPSLRAIEMLTSAWAAAPGTQELYPSTSALRDGRGRVLVTSYALRGSDGRWSLLLVNRSAGAIEESLDFANAPGLAARPVKISRYSQRQYRWSDPRPGGHPALDAEPATHVDRSWNGRLMLDPMSLTVVTGRWDHAPGTEVAVLKAARRKIAPAGTP